MTTRSWDDSTTESGRYRTSGYSEWEPYTFTSVKLTGNIQTFNNPGYKHSRGDSGSPFHLYKEEYRAVTAKAPTGNLGYGARIDGPVFVSGPSQNWAPLTWPGSSTLVGLDALGTTAIARVEPTNPSASLATFIGEMREGIPSAIGVSTWRDRTRLHRGAGSEYLNLEFGWKPLVSELRSFFSAVDNSEKILASYHKDSGQKMRRSFHFPEATETQVYSGTFTYQPAQVSRLGFPRGIRVEESGRKAWFSGAFRYHIPMGTDTISKFQRWGSDARKLLGIELTPEVVWNLSPWSWAADWFANTGDVIHNISALGRDGMAMQYGYMMEESYLRTSTTASWSEFGMTAKRDTYRSLKRRRPATPFGFGVDLNSLSAKQVAIAAALGLSRS